MKWLCVTLLVLVVACPAKAAEFSGDYLLQVCSSNKEGKEFSPGSHTACQAYISGIIDYHRLMRSMGAGPGIDFCVPEGTSLYKIQHNIFKYLYQNHHEQGPFIAAPAVALALHKSYPCTKKKKTP